MARTFAAGFGANGERVVDLDQLDYIKEDVMDDGAESHNDPLASDEELEQVEQMEQRPEMNMLSDDYGN